MSTTRSRRIRRQRSFSVQQRAQQHREQAIVDQILEEYKKNPNEALNKCFNEFGRDEFENALRVHLHRHVAMVAYQLAIKDCVREKRYNEWAEKDTAKALKVAEREGYVKWTSEDTETLVSDLGVNHAT